MLHKKLKRVGVALAASTVIAAMLVPQAAFAVNLKISGSTTVQPLTQKLATAYKKKVPGSTITVAGGGSSVGFKDAAAGRVNIGMSSRDYAVGKDPAGLVMHTIARDSLTVVVNPKNPVRKLTSQQVMDIYHGKITNWKQVGGPNKRIIVCGRTGASGTYEYFKEAFLGNKRQSSKTKGYASNGMVRSAVARNKYAVGYVGMAFVNRSVRAVRIDGVSATRANAMSGKYKYVRPLYLITKGEATGDTKAFIDWVKGSAGQKIAGAEFLPAK